MVLWMVHLWLVRMYRGVAALGLSYAVKQRRHFKATEFIESAEESAKPLTAGILVESENLLSQSHLSAGAFLQSRTVEVCRQDGYRLSKCRKFA